MRYSNQKMEKLWYKARQETWWNVTLISSCIAMKLLHILFLRCSVSAGAEAKVQIVLCSVTTWIHFLASWDRANSGILYRYLRLHVYLFTSLKLINFQILLFLSYFLHISKHCTFPQTSAFFPLMNNSSCDTCRGPGQVHSIPAQIREVSMKSHS